MRILAVVAGAAMLGLLSGHALADGGFRPHTPPSPDRGFRSGTERQAPPRNDALRFHGQAPARFGSTRPERQPDPNYQNPYRPMYSFGATNPGEPHPYFQTRKEGFGYPAAPASRGVYRGEGYYVIPR